MGIALCWFTALHAHVTFSCSPETIEFPFTMTDLHAGTWILQGLTAGARVMVAGKESKSEFLSPAVMENLKASVVRVHIVAGP